MAQTRIKRRRFAAAAWSGEEYRSRALSKEFFELAQKRIRQADLVQVEHAGARSEDAHRRLLAMNRGERAHAHIYAEPGPAFDQASLLRHVLAIGEQLGHDFKPAHHIGCQVSAEHRSRVQDA